MFHPEIWRSGLLATRWCYSHTVPGRGCLISFPVYGRLLLNIHIIHLIHLLIHKRYSHLAFAPGSVALFPELGFSLKKKNKKILCVNQMNSVCLNRIILGDISATPSKLTLWVAVHSSQLAVEVFNVYILTSYPPGKANSSSAQSY